MPPSGTASAAAAGDDPVLDRRALNRATLARQWLLQRHQTGALEAVEHLVGMQSQAPLPPYYGLWTRLEGFHPDHLATLLTDRRAVRMTLMRGTVHLVSARDCRTLRPLLQPGLERHVAGAHEHTAGLAGVDPAEIVRAGRAMLAERPLTKAQTRERFAELWPERDPAALAWALPQLLPVVQVPPRGIWGKSGRPACAVAEDWVGAPLDHAPDPETVFLRYLAAFGPASVADAQKWSGLSGLGAVAERLRPRLLALRDEHGRRLYDLPDAPRPDPDTPAPVRFLPDFDNLLLSHADRTRVISEADRARVFTVNGIIRATLLVEGTVRGTWSIARARGAATLDIDLFAPLSAAQRAETQTEAARLLAFAAPEADRHDIRLHDPT